MSCTHACALSWHLQLSLASPAESEMTIISERLCISPTEAIRQRDRAHMQQLMRYSIDASCTTILLAKQEESGGDLRGSPPITTRAGQIAVALIPFMM